MSSTTPTAELPRRRLTERQAEMVRRLTEAAAEVIREKSYEGLTVRNVAARAGVAPATAYTYFASKDHLVAEVFWRKLRSLPEPSINPQDRPAFRVGTALRDVTSFLAVEPQLAAASTTALLAADPDVKHLRDRIGGEMRRRISAVGESDAELQALELIVAGAMIQAGMGHLAYEDLPDLITEVATLVVRGD